MYTPYVYKQLIIYIDSYVSGNTEIVIIKYIASDWYKDMEQPAYQEYVEFIIIIWTAFNLAKQC